jgi:serine phosphatase RsbU (regulator of sigma subunit)
VDTTLADSGGLAALEPLARQQVQSRRLSPAIWEQISALPLEALDAHPWTMLYAGRRLCRQQSRFGEANGYIDRALAAFRRARDEEGELWAMAEWLVMRYHRHEYDTGLALIDGLLARSGQAYLRAEFLFARFLCLIGRSYAAEAVAAGHAALEALDQEPDPWLARIGRIQMLRNIAAGYYYTGRMRRAVAAAEEAVALAADHPDTADMAPWCHYELGLALWRKGEFARARATLDRARRLAESWGHQQLWYWTVAAQAGLLLDQGRISEAWEHFEVARVWGEDDHGPLLIQLREGRLSEARWGAQYMLDHVPSTSPAARADVEMFLALVDIREGALDAALERLGRIHAIYTSQGYHYRLISVELYSAAAHLARGEIAEADGLLLSALSFAFAEQIYRFEWTLPDLLAPVLQHAARHSIAPEYLAELSARLLPPVRPAAGRNQPLSLEMEIARRTQINLLPQRPPLMPDLDIAGTSLPAEEVGGDFFGYFPAGANPEHGEARVLGLAVGDISGKGLPAALLLSGTVVALSTIVASYPPPGEVARRMHSALTPYTSRNRLNIALCYAELAQHAEGWRMRVASAGGVPPLIRRRDGSVEWLEVGGLPLGTIPVDHYQEAETLLRKGDTLLLLSDGLAEAMNERREIFGFDALERTLAAAPFGAGADAILSLMLDAVHAHIGGGTPHDDMTLAVVRVLGGSPVEKPKADR